MKKSAYGMFGAGLAIAAMLFLGTCSSPLLGTDDVASSDSRSLITTVIKDSNAKMESLIMSDLLSLPDILPAGTTTPVLLKVDGIPLLNQKYGPVTFTGYHYQSQGSTTVVGIDFVSEMPVIAMYVKGGNVGKDDSGRNVAGGNFYTWSEGSTMGGSELTTAVNPANGLKTGISHIEFAWIPLVLLSVSTETSYDRQYDWSISKVNNASSITPNSLATPFMLDPGQSVPVLYTVGVRPVPVDYNFVVGGTIVVSNPAYNQGQASIASVTAGDSIVEPAASVIQAGSSAEFLFSFGTTSASAGLVNVTVLTDGNIGGARGIAGYSFGNPANIYDTSIALVDDLVPAANRTISLGDSLSFSYTHGVSASVTTPAAISNTATYTENDTLRSGSARSDVWVQLKPSSGYTRSQGYWKTHANSSYQNHPAFDSTWNKFGAGNGFFLSGKTNIDVMWTPPAGNVYYNLASQYVGAKLNVLTGYAAPSDVLSALARAEYYFRLYTPGQTGSWKANDAKRQEMILVAGILGAFNIDRNTIQ